MNDPGGQPPLQEMLFTDGLAEVPDELLGYRGTTACNAAGITYRQLDYWARTDLIRPEGNTDARHRGDAGGTETTDSDH